MTEHIITIILKELTYNKIISYCEEFYRKTGRKFSITFNGSKGYVDNITFFIEVAGDFEIRLRGQEKIFFFMDDKGEFHIQESK